MQPHRLISSILLWIKAGTPPIPNIRANGIALLHLPTSRLLAVSLSILLQWEPVPSQAADPTPSRSPRLIRVPGSWESQPSAEAAQLSGYAWYRTWLKPHDSFFTPHERDLFAESVHLNIRQLAAAHEVFINGKRIGSGGQMPPQFKASGDSLHRHKVPPGLLLKGQWNCIAIRVYNASGPGGFLGDAPFIMDYFNECVLEGPWEFYPGDHPELAASASLSQPSHSSFDQYHDSHRVLGEAAELTHGPKKSPAESQRDFQPRKEFQIETLLTEPLVAQPVHISFDQRGRMWIAQYRQYPYPAGLKMLSRDRYYRAHYDKVPPPPPHHDRGRDVISIHEDTDGDGLPDRHKVFVDGLNMANAALPGKGGVWIMNTPYLLFYPDADGDDIPDGPPVVHLAGFGLEDTHSVANGLIWGPDGWIYGGQGSTTSSHVVRPGIDPPDDPGVYFEGCMVWRYHPVTRVYEIFAEGSGNTFGLELDSEGRLFSGHNGGETRGWHYLQNGFYLKQGVDPGKFGPPRNPYVYGQLPPLRPRQSIQRFTHLFAVGEGTALPTASQGSLFAIDPLHNLVMESHRHILGSTFETSDLGVAVSSADTAFRPVFIVNAPDGALYIADFYEHYIAHGQHFQSQIDPTTGRIYRLKGAGMPLEKELHFADLSSDALVGLLNHPNKWHRHTAVRILTERKDSSTEPLLIQSLTDPMGSAALGSLWVLHQTDWLQPTHLLTALNHPLPTVRMWAVRLAGDRWGTHPGLGSRNPPGPAPLPADIRSALLSLATRESNAEVRSQIASTARRLPSTVSFELATHLASHDEDLKDPFLPHLYWWIFENKLPSESKTILALSRNRDLWNHPIFTDHIFPRIVRRLASEARPEDFLACAEWLQRAPSPEIARKLVRGFEEAFQGQSLPVLPALLMDALAQSKGDTLSLRLRQGSKEVLPQVMALVTQPATPREDRLLYIRLLGETRWSEAAEPLWSIVQAQGAPEVRRAALHSLAALHLEVTNSLVPGRLLAAFSSWPTELQSTTFEICLSRSPWTALLLSAIESGMVPAQRVPNETADRLVRHKNTEFRSRAARLFPQSNAENAATAKRLAELEQKILAQPGNPYAGESTFIERCSSCHRLFHKGRDVGPDLTHYQRDHLGTLLMSILNPNAEIREGFLAYDVEARDGQTWTGILLHRDARVIGLRTTDGETVTLSQQEIVSLEPTGRSLMPEGLLAGLDDQKLRDFIAFLRSSQPFTR